MDSYGRSQPSGHRTTLEEMKEELYSLNMRLRLALQNNDHEMRISLEKQIGELHKAIEDMSAGSGWL